MSSSHIKPEEVDGFEFDPSLNGLIGGESAAKQYGKPSIKAFFTSSYVVMCSAAAAIGGFLFGFDQGLISIILGMDHFLDRFPEVNEAASGSAAFNKGMMTALLELGAALGALQSGYAADRISRRYVLFLGTLWFTLGSTLQTAAMNFATLVVGRFIGGIGIGTLACVAPLFIGEIAPPHLRGAMLVFESWMVVLGVVIAFYITYATQYISTEWSFRLPFLLQMIPGFVLVIMIYFMPFSPRWLCQKGREAEALNTLSKLRQLPTSDPRVQAEWVEIRADVYSNRDAFVSRHPNLASNPDGIKGEMVGWIDCFRPGVFRRTIIGIGLQFFQQFIGVNAIVYYAPTLYATLGFDREAQLTYSGITNIMQLVGVTPTFFLMDRVGRKPLLLLGSVVTCSAHVITGSMVARFGSNWPAHPTEARVGIAMLMIFMFSFGTSWAPIPWAVAPEVSASSFRSKSVALAVVSNWVNNFIIGLITPILVKETNGYGAFFFFASFAALSFFFVWFLVPETKGVSLEDMDSLFHSKTGVEDEQRRLNHLAAILRVSATPSPAFDDGKLGKTDNSEQFEVAPAAQRSRNLAHV